MLINVYKTEPMIIANDNRNRSIKLKGNVMEQVQAFKYLGSAIEGNDTIDRCLKEIIGSMERLVNAIKSQLFSKKEINGSI